MTNGVTVMARTGAELAGFEGAIALLLDEEAYLAWTAGRHQVPLKLAERRAVADYLSAVGGDGTLAGTLHELRDAIGDGDGWVAPSTAEPDDPKAGPIWHALGDQDDDGAWRSACGTAELAWDRGCRLIELSPGVRHCGQAACQKRMVL